MRPAVYSATSADHSSGVSTPPSRLRSIKGTTIICLMRLSLCLLASLVATNLAAQPVAHHIAAGDSAGLMHPQVQQRHYQPALAGDSMYYAATWTAARAIADVARQRQRNADSLHPRRDRPESQLSRTRVGRGLHRAREVFEGPRTV